MSFVKNRELSEAEIASFSPEDCERWLDLHGLVYDEVDRPEERTWALPNFVRGYCGFPDLPPLENGTIEQRLEHLRTELRAEHEDEPFDSVGFIIDLEAGILGGDEIIEGFQHLIDSGLAWSLQGSYGRTAQALIEQGLCTAP